MRSTNWRALVCWTLAIGLWMLPASILQAQVSDTIQSIRGHRKARPKARTHAPVRRPRPAHPRSTVRRTAAHKAVSRKPVVRRSTSTPPVPAVPSDAVVVSVSGGSRYRTIGEAIRGAPPGKRIDVRPGVYAESLLLDRPVEIRGIPDEHGALPVIESPSGACISATGEHVVLRGLALRTRAGAGSMNRYAVEIRQGGAQLVDCEIHGIGERGVIVRPKASGALLLRCVITGDIGDSLVFDDNAKGTVDECYVSAVDGACVVVGRGAEPVLHICKLHAAKASGIRFAEGAGGQLVDCEVYDNQGAGVLICKDAVPVLKRCTVRSNQREGVLALDGAGGSLESCVIRGNAGPGLSAPDGASVGLSGSAVDTVRGILSWWPLDGDATDAVGGNTGRIIGNVTPAKGIVGQGMRFSGAGSGIVLGDPDNLKLAGPLSICAWICPTALPSQEQGQILFRGDDRSGLDPYFLCYRADGQVRFGIGSADNRLDYVEALVPLGVFTHVVGVLNTGAHVMRLYLNGAEVASKSTSLTPFRDLDGGASPGAAIGSFQSRPGGPEQCFAGILDEVQIYCRALNPVDIACIYRNR